MVGMKRLGIAGRLIPVSVMLSMLTPSDAAFAQNFRNRPVHVIATEPGGAADLSARTIALKLGSYFGQSFVVENKGGAAGAIAAVSVARSTPDGYTLLYFGSVLWTLPMMRRNVGYDVLRDFSPISIATSSPYFLYINSSVPVNTVKELIAFARKFPGKLNYGTTGTGATPHMAGELFKSMAEVDIVRVPYKGTGASITDLLTGQLQMLLGTAQSGLPNVKTGKLKVLGIANEKPSALAPDIPTIAASGLPDFEISSTSVMLAPAKTPTVIVQRIYEGIVKALSDPEVKKRFFDAGIEPVGTTPEQSLAYIKKDITKWAKVVREAGIVDDEQ